MPYYEVSAQEIIRYSLLIKADSIEQANQIADDYPVGQWQYDGTDFWIYPELTVETSNYKPAINEE